MASVWRDSRGAHKSLILLRIGLCKPLIVLERLGRTAICSSALQTGGRGMTHILRGLFQDEQGQDIAEYAVMLAVILVIVVGTVRLIGSNANTVFSQVASTIQ